MWRTLKFVTIFLPNKNTQINNKLLSSNLHRKSMISIFLRRDPKVSVKKKVIMSILNECNLYKNGGRGGSQLNKKWK